MNKQQDKHTSIHWKYKQYIISKAQPFSSALNQIIELTY